MAIGAQLDRFKTDTNLKEVIMNLIDRALAGRPISVGYPFVVPFRAMEKIGWRCLLQGYPGPQNGEQHTNTCTLLPQKRHPKTRPNE
jgi:hypothetical protein